MIYIYIYKYIDIKIIRKYYYSFMHAFMNLEGIYVGNPVNSFYQNFNLGTD